MTKDINAAKDCLENACPLIELLPVDDESGNRVTGGCFALLREVYKELYMPHKKRAFLSHVDDGNDDVEELQILSNSDRNDMRRGRRGRKSHQDFENFDVKYSKGLSKSVQKQLNDMKVQCMRCLDDVGNSGDECSICTDWKLAYESHQTNSDKFDSNSNEVDVDGINSVVPFEEFDIETRIEELRAPFEHLRSDSRRNYDKESILDVTDSITTSSKLLDEFGESAYEIASLILQFVEENEYGRIQILEKLESNSYDIQRNIINMPSESYREEDIQKFAILSNTIQQVMEQCIKHGLSFVMSEISRDSKELSTMDYSAIFASSNKDPNPLEDKVRALVLDEFVVALRKGNIGIGSNTFKNTDSKRRSKSDSIEDYNPSSDYGKARKRRRSHQTFPENFNSRKNSNNSSSVLESLFSLILVMTFCYIGYIFYRDFDMRYTILISNCKRNVKLKPTKWDILCEVMLSYLQTNSTIASFISTMKNDKNKNSQLNLISSIRDFSFANKNHGVTKIKPSMVTIDEDFFVETKKSKKDKDHAIPNVPSKMNRNLQIRADDINYEDEDEDLASENMDVNASADSLSVVESLTSKVLPDANTSSLDRSKKAKKAHASSDSKVSIVKVQENQIQIKNSAPLESTVSEKLTFQPVTAKKTKAGAALVKSAKLQVPQTKNIAPPSGSLQSHEDSNPKRIPTTNNAAPIHTSSITAKLNKPTPNIRNKEILKESISQTQTEKTATFTPEKLSFENKKIPNTTYASQVISSISTNDKNHDTIVSTSNIADDDDDSIMQDLKALITPPTQKRAEVPAPTQLPPGIPLHSLTNRSSYSVNMNENEPSAFRTYEYSSDSFATMNSIPDEFGFPSLGPSFNAYPSILQSDSVDSQNNSRAHFDNLASVIPESSFDQLQGSFFPTLTPQVYDDFHRSNTSRSDEIFGLSVSAPSFTPSFAPLSLQQSLFTVSDSQQQFAINGSSNASSTGTFNKASVVHRRVLISCRLNFATSSRINKVKIVCSNLDTQVSALWKSLVDPTVWETVLLVPRVVEVISYSYVLQDIDGYMLEEQVIKRMTFNPLRAEDVEVQDQILLVHKTK